MKHKDCIAKVVNWKIWLILLAKKCVICNSKTPSLNCPSEKHALYCSDCKNEEMIYIYKNFEEDKVILNFCFKA